MAIPILETAQTTRNDEGNRYLFPLILVTGLFLLWGLSYGLLDVLNKHFQETLHIDKARSTLVQMAYFGAYFLIALPAGIFMNRFGYKKGIITGFFYSLLGLFFFIPLRKILVSISFCSRCLFLLPGLLFLKRLLILTLPCWVTRKLQNSG